MIRARTQFSPNKCVEFLVSKYRHKHSVNHLVERDRKFMIDILLTGLSRLEYRGYDSAGIAIDGDKEDEVLNKLIKSFIFKQVGKVNALKSKIVGLQNVDMERIFVASTGMAHTRCRLLFLPRGYSRTSI